jgi:hypothetical protein
MLLRSEGRAEDQRPAARDVWLLLLNGGSRSKPFSLPVMGYPGGWVEVVNTLHTPSRGTREGNLPLGARALVLLRYQPESPAP